MTGDMEDNRSMDGSVNRDGVVRHAPNDATYNRPDTEQSRRLGSRHVVVPKANNDGTSSGFDANTPAVVHVDPDAKDGGRIVDLQQVSKRSMREAMAGSSEPYQVYYRLSELPSLPSRTPTTREASQPMNPQGVPLMQGSARPEIQPNVYQQPAPYPQPQPIPYPQPMQFQQPFAPPTQDPAIMSAISQLSVVVQGLSAQMHELQRPQQVPQALQRNPVAPVTRGLRTLPPEDEDDVPEIRTTASRQLSTSKPKRTVVFNYGPLGTMSCHYHDVIDTEYAVILVFNTQQAEFSQQYLPGASYTPFEIVIDRDNSIFVAHIGLVFRYQDHDFTVLVKRGTDPAEQTEDQA